jgi:hypothetical protein
MLSASKFEALSYQKYSFVSFCPSVLLTLIYFRYKSMGTTDIKLSIIVFVLYISKYTSCSKVFQEEIYRSYKGPYFHIILPRSLASLLPFPFSSNPYNLCP